MTVAYAVWRHYISSGNSHLVGLFSTKEKANNIAKDFNKSYFKLSNCDHSVHEEEIDSKAFAKMYVH